MLTDCTHTFTWDALGNPLTIDSVTLTYDALGRIVEELNGGSYTQIVYGPTGAKLAIMNGGNLQQAIIPLPMGAAAVYKSGGLTYYRRVDWLGNARLSTKPDGSLYYKAEYAPYGENYDGTTGSGGATVLAFTEQSQDTVGGLYDFMFREYNQSHGRWPWPDPAGIGVASLESPQTLNQYAYVGNTPLTAVDALGLFRGEAYYDNAGLRNDDGCYLTFSCGVFVDQFGMQIDSRVAQQELHNGSGAICPQCALTTIPGAGFAWGNVGADDSIGWSFAFPTIWAGKTLTNAALAEALGLPSNLPQGTPKKYWDPFEQGFDTALKDLGKKKCGAFFGGEGPATMKGTEYRFLDLNDADVGAQTNSATSVFINSAGPYMTYSPTPGQAGPFGRHWSQSQFRAFILLHELAHQLSPITGFQADAGKRSLNQAQSGQVIGACF